MATVSRPNAFRKRRTTLVNPHRRKLTAAQKLAGFGGKAKQRAAERMKSASRRKPYRPNRAAHFSRQSRPAGARRKARPNVSAIVTAGLPIVANPYTKKRKRTTSKMANKSHKRRRPNASKKTSTARRRRASFAPKKRTNPHSHRPRTKYRTRTVVKYRYRKNSFSRRRRARSNPSSSGMGTKNLLIQSAVATLNAVGSRWISQFALGDKNTGPMGYGANIGAGLIGAYAAKKFLGKSAGYAALLGLGVSVLLRAAQDFTPWGAALALNGYGDSGMGALMPMDFVNPQQYTPDNAAVLKPGSWQPPVTPVAAAGRRGMAGTHNRSTYR